RLRHAGPRVPAPAHRRVRAAAGCAGRLGVAHDTPRTARSADPRPARAWPRHSHAPVARPPLVCHAQFVADPRRAAGAPRRVLGGVRNTAALNALLALVDGGTNWLGRPKLAARSLELLAALMALAAGWRNDVRAAAVLALAAASKDPDVRSAAIRR